MITEAEMNTIEITCIAFNCGSIEPKGKQTTKIGIMMKMFYDMGTAKFEDAVKIYDKQDADTQFMYLIQVSYQIIQGDFMGKMFDEKEELKDNVFKCSADAFALIHKFHQRTKHYLV